MNNKQFEACQKQVNLSYSPYSNYKVAAAVLLKDGSIITGMNIENASYPLSICAERVALFRTYASGYKKDDIVSLMVYSNRTDSYPYPCGACRQVMSELMDLESDVIVVNESKKEDVLKVKDLLPFAFTKENL